MLIVYTCIQVPGFQPGSRNVAQDLVHGIYTASYRVILKMLTSEFGALPKRSTDRTSVATKFGTRYPVVETCGASSSALQSCTGMTGQDLSHTACLRIILRYINSVFFCLDIPQTTSSL